MRHRKSTPTVDILEERQLLSAGTVTRPPAAPWIEFQSPPPGMIAALSARIGAVETSLGKLDARVGNMETHSNSVDARLDALEARVAALEAKPDQSAIIAELQATVANQATEITAMMQQIADSKTNLDIVLSPIRNVTESMPIVKTYGGGFDALAPDKSLQVLEADPNRFFVSITVHGGDTGGYIAFSTSKQGALNLQSSLADSWYVGPGADKTLFVFGDNYSTGFSLSSTNDLWAAGDPGLSFEATTYDCIN